MSNNIKYNNRTRCYKCRDTFINNNGGYSQRASCRYHEFKNGECIHCHIIQGGNITKNCYHIKEEYLCSVCVIS